MSGSNKCWVYQVEFQINAPQHLMEVLAFILDKLVTLVTLSARFC